MSQEAYVLGNGVSLFADFTDVDGNPVDPSAITLTVRAPDGSDSTFTWPPEGSITQVRDASDNPVVGSYKHTFLPDQEGLYRYQWVSTTPSGAIEGTFLVYTAFTPGPNNSYTYDLATDIGKLRLNIDDRDLRQVTADVPLGQRTAIFSDEELQAFLDAEGTVSRASAKALITIANNRQLLVQSRRIGNTDVDYGAVRRDLLAQAKALLDLDSGQFSENAPADGTAEIAYNDFGLRDVIFDAQLRDSA
jgi:hypothetical protein